MKIRDLESLLGKARFFQTVWIALEHKTIFISNPKCGCSSIKSVLVEHSESLSANKFNIHQRKKFDKDIMRQLLTEDADLSSFSFFSTTREPVARTISAYVDKMQKDCVQRQEVKRLLYLPQDDSPVSWSDFLKSVVKFAPSSLNPHWRPQHLTIHTKTITYNELFKLERADQDLVPYLNSQLGASLKSLPRRNVKSNNDKIAKPVLSRNDVRCLKRLYVVDMFTMGYASITDFIVYWPEYLKYRIAPAWFSDTPVAHRSFFRLLKDSIKSTLG